MLLIDKVILKTKYNTNLDYYKNLGYNVEGDDFEVNINHLLKNSFTLVKVSCDYCNTKEEIPYYKWNRSMESIVKKYCCNLCKGDKIKESNLIKYGVTSVGKLETSKEKTKKTNLEKFGVEYKYIIDGKRTHKSKWRKSKTGISESKLNISKIWDCGKIKYYLLYHIFLKCRLYSSLDDLVYKNHNY